MRESKSSASQNAQTVQIFRKVRQGFEKEFEELSFQLTQRAARFPGFLGSALFRPASPSNPEYEIVFKFKNPNALMDWEASEQRAAILKKIEPLLMQSQGETSPKRVKPLKLKDTSSDKPAPKWKMTVVIWLALYPAVTLVSFVFNDWLEQLPFLLRTMFVTIVVTLLMSYILMPCMTRWFHGWLFPYKK